MTIAAVDVLLPTCNRFESLALALAGLASQSCRRFRVVIADQSIPAVRTRPVVQAAARILESRGRPVEWHHRIPSKGIAEQRHFLLSRATADYVLFLDDDVYMEPWVLDHLVRTIREEDCGFVGAFPTGLSFAGDVRPDQQTLELWDGPVRPEALEPGTEAWERWQLHRAANLWHASRRLQPNEVHRYKVAWVASCVLYDRKKLLSVGGLSFWNRLPRYHSGEEVLAQNLLLRRYGGCGIVPSGTFHAELPSTVLNDEGRVDGHALELLPEMIRQYAVV